MPRRDLAVDRDGLEVQGFEQRYLAGVGAGEGGFQFRCNALLESLRAGGSELLQEGCGQPAPDSPCHAENSVEFDRTPPPTPLNIDLLLRCGAVSGLFRGLLLGGSPP